MESILSPDASGNSLLTPQLNDDVILSIRLHLDLGVPQHRVAELVALRHLAYWRLSGHAIRNMDHCYKLYTTPERRIAALLRALFCHSGIRLDTTMYLSGRQVCLDTVGLFEQEVDPVQRLLQQRTRG